ncbi:hypothetical protein GGR50DRAFT_704354 [Xylaria sp. CBS 124048]|nr:hypothetical protein GGR50DRAFT_704354 [Xylaria sp. CBS 124048]
MSPSMSKKRIIVCCDSTWQNSDNGHSTKNKAVRLQTPSNVTRISRCFRRKCSDGTFQIIYYQSGVGSKSGVLDRLFGGAFGTGISENIREAYAFVCANYVDGDDIVLLGFSRGAFTVRSIGGMISDLGLLTREGMEYFYPIFKDMQNWSNDRYKDPFPTMPFTDKPKGENAAAVYRQQLIQKGYARVRWDQNQDALIRVLAIGVWDTVGSLGIPDERRSDEQNTSDLRQVWFPGSHGNIGGGWPDQGIADITLAWMMDQLSSVGCEFKSNALDRLVEASVAYYESQAQAQSLMKKHKQHKNKLLDWAEKSIHESNYPVRPWGLHSIRTATGPLSSLTGSVTRAPGMYHKINPKDGRPLPEFLEDTDERIHPSVRVRLACEGLGLNDTHVWCCPALLNCWRPQRVFQEHRGSSALTAESEPSSSERRGESSAARTEEQRGTADETNPMSESLRMMRETPSERWV